MPTFRHQQTAKTVRRPACERAPDTIVYINDPMPTGGPSLLLEQMRAVQAHIWVTGIRVDRFIIESGGRLTGDGRGQRLQDVIDLARAVPQGTLLIANLQHLAKEPHNVLSAAADILEAGLNLRDPTGTLYPSPERIAIFRAAARGALWQTRADRLPRHRRSRNRTSHEADLDEEHRSA